MNDKIMPMKRYLIGVKGKKECEVKRKNVNGIVGKKKKHPRFIVNNEHVCTISTRAQLVFPRHI